jgi:hypothetical protein
MGGLDGLNGEGLSKIDYLMIFLGLSIGNAGQG